LNITSRQAAQMAGTVGWALTTSPGWGIPTMAGFADTVTATTVKKAPALMQSKALTITG
jgi:hypothetical protein